MRLTKKQKIAVLEEAIQWYQRPSCIVIGGIIDKMLELHRPKAPEYITKDYFKKYYTDVNKHLKSIKTPYWKWNHLDRLEYMNEYLKQLKG